METLRVNTALVRRRICPRRSSSWSRAARPPLPTARRLLYLEGVADPALVEELAGGWTRIDVDALLATGLLEEGLTDAPGSPFPQLLHTERPDRFAQLSARGARRPAGRRAAGGAGAAGDLCGVHEGHRRPQQQLPRRHGADGAALSRAVFRVCCCRRCMWRWPCTTRR